MPHRNKPPHPDLLALIVLGVVAAMFVGGYFAFPYVQRAIWYQNCIASGRITGC